MKSLFLERPGCLSLRDVPTPEPGPEEVLVKVEAATTCGTDLKAYRRGHPQIPMPGPFGHEYSGIVADAGPGAKFKSGDAVMGVHSAPCRSCEWCRRGQENLCESIMAEKVLGSFAEYLLIPSRIASLNLFPKPDDIAFEQASLLEPLACVAQGILELRLVDGDSAPRLLSALVIGPGAIGLMFVAALRRLGIERVALAGRNQSRLKVGARLGAEIVSWPNDSTTQRPNDLPKFDLVIECTGQTEVWERSVDFASRGGSVLLFGGCPSGTRVSFDTARLHYDQIDLVSSFHFGTSAVQMAREWLLDPKFRLDGIISGSRTLEQAEETFADLEAGKGIKYVFSPSPLGGRSDRVSDHDAKPGPQSGPRVTEKGRGEGSNK